VLSTAVSHSLQADATPATSVTSCNPDVAASSVSTGDTLQVSADKVIPL